jgi:hypothetical protein
MIQLFRDVKSLLARFAMYTVLKGTGPKVAVNVSFGSGAAVN